MSVFPYSQVSPPPTAGPLTIVDRANQETPYNGGGGGGGGGAGPNPAVSSLTINNFSANPNGALAFTYDFPSQLNTLPANSVGLTQAVVKDSAGNNTNSLISFVNNGGSNLTIDFASARVHVGAQGTGSSAAARGTIAYDGTANLMTFSPASISSLSVSSLNGAAPGGGSVGPTLNLSSLNINPTGYIEMFQNPSNQSGQIIGYQDINNVSSIAIGVGFVPNYNDKVNNTDALWLVEADPTGANQRYGDFGMGRAVILGNNASITKKPPVLDCAAGDGNLQVNGVGNMTISTAFLYVPEAETTISSLSVSSINGAAPGGGSAPFFSTLFNGNSTINCDGLVTQPLILFSTTTNHLYQIQTQMTIAPRAGGGQPGTLDDDVVQEVFNVINMNVTSGAVISSLFAVSRNIDIGTMGMWKATAPGAALIINGSFSTTATMTSVVLADFGAV